jgi:tetratricopeptide (TPR) repeat protein
MQRNILFGIVGLVIGLVIGFGAANSINRQDDLNTSSTNNSSQQLAPQSSRSGGMLADVDQMIQTAQSEPQNFVAQMRTGDMYAKIGKFDSAIEFYKRGILLKPDDFNANVVLANALFDSQRFEEASDYYAKAVKINGADVNARTDLGTTFVERSNPDFERAIREFKAALEIDPKHEPTLYYLGIAYLRKGEKDKADRTLAELEKANPASSLIGRLRQNIEAN